MSGYYQAPSNSEARAWAYALSFYELETSATPEESFITMQRPPAIGTTKDEISDDEEGAGDGRGRGGVAKVSTGYSGLGWLARR